MANFYTSTILEVIKAGKGPGVIMAASSSSSQASGNLKQFLNNLKAALVKCSSVLTSASQAIPHWASNFTHLVYSHKSIPPEIKEPGELYLAYKSDEPCTVKLVGKSKDQKPINRKLKIDRQASVITITSEHKDFSTGRSYTCRGIGKTFKLALDHYFSASDLRTSNYGYNIESNLQKEGDAFILPQMIKTKGNEHLIKELVNTVSELIKLIPEEKYPEVLPLIEKNLKNFNAFLADTEKEKIAYHYDARLWLIIESICKHFDPLGGSEDAQRKNLRDHLLAKCCSKFLKGEDIISMLRDYFEALKMHLEIFAAAQKEGLDEQAKALINEYKKSKLYPEINGHHEKIREYHSKCKKSTKATS